MPKKLKKLIWLLEHIPSLIKAHNGFFPLFRDTLVLMKKIGVRSALGLFIGQVAYERRNNADAYRQWIRITENGDGEPGLDYDGITHKYQDQYLFLLHPGAQINTAALRQLDAAIIANPAADVFYGDHDQISAMGQRSNPSFKPCFSIDLLRSSNYVGPFLLIRKSSIATAGELEPDGGRATIFDWLLRAHEAGLKFHHVPYVLSHVARGTTYESVDPFWAFNSDVLFNHLHRTYGKTLNVGFASDDTGGYSARYVSRDALVSIIIPTKDQLYYLEQCVHSILAETIDCRFEIIILNNNSVEEKTYRWFDAIGKAASIKILEASYPFNWSKLNNHGIAESNGNFFVFLNNDTRVISKTWLRQLAGQAAREDVGTVGPLLLYADGTVQHAGMVVGYGGQADHVYSGFPPDVEGSVFASPLLQRNVLANTGACLVTSKRAIERVGVFDESMAVVGSDIEICLRVHGEGLLNVYDPSVKLYHYESKTRANQPPRRDLLVAGRIYEKFMREGDPFFNKNVSLASKFPLPDVFGPR